jgi:peptidoglycan/LPS O-acetylase OafA/YrhL
MEWNHELFSAWGNSFWDKHVPVKDLLYTLSMFRIPDTKLIDPPIWYIAVENKMLFIIPILVWLTQRHGWYIAILCFVVSLIPSEAHFGLNWIFAYLGGFMMRKAIEEYPQVKKWFVTRSRAVLFGIVIAGLLLIDFYNITHIVNYESLHIYYGIQTLGAMLLISVVYLRPLKLLNNKWLVKLGDISYQIYLLHFIVMLTLRSLSLPLWAFVLSDLLITLFLSELLFVVDERINKKLCCLLKLK